MCIVHWKMFLEPAVKVHPILPISYLRQVSATI